MHFFFFKHKLELVPILTPQKLATGNQISVKLFQKESYEDSRKLNSVKRSN